MNKYVVSIAATLFLTGCAGSANHEVVSAHQATDENMSCGQLTAEMVRTQAIIDGVIKDKEDLSGADVVDGVLWFPFNLIAKNSNYNAAMDAADRRIERLSELKTAKACANDDIKEQSQALSAKLIELNELYKKGILSEDEYRAAKSKALGLAQN